VFDIQHHKHLKTLDNSSTLSPHFHNTKISARKTSSGTERWTPSWQPMLPKWTP